MANVIQFPHPIAPIQPIAHFVRLNQDTASLRVFTRQGDCRLAELSSTRPD